jgi:hypothetical protein
MWSAEWVGVVRESKPVRSRRVAEGLKTTQLSRSRGGLRTAGVGQEERFLPTRLSAGCGFRKETIAGMRRNGRDAPKPVVASKDGQLAAFSTMSAAFSPIIIDGALVLPDVSVGMIEASATRRPAMPWTRSWASTTAIGSDPILQVPTGW